jgi:hypothetical protein
MADKQLWPVAIATASGALNKLPVHAASDVPVDLFATTTERWFVSLVVCMGSKERNTMLACSAGCSSTPTACCR